ncbi:MAG: hypothetical protein JSS27_11840 [Planctomycetes bacterium]|nr:hypothetical protein [Planctomycetota bacterium]
MAIPLLFIAKTVYEDRWIARQVLSELLAQGAIVYDDNDSLVDSAFGNESWHSLPRRIKKVNISASPFEQSRFRTLNGISHLSTIEELVLSYAALDSTSLAQIALMPNLQRLILANAIFLDSLVDDALGSSLRQIDLTGIQLTPQTIRLIVERCPKLEALDLGNATFSNSELARLKTLPRLRSLSLSHTNSDENAVAELRACKQLYTLRLDGNPLSDGIVEMLVTLPSLQELNLAGTMVTDVGVIKLAPHGLKSLDVTGTDITNKSAIALARYPTLKVLRLGATRIDDDSVESLSMLRGLNTLSIWKTRISQNGVNRIRRSLVDCKVVSDFDVPSRPDLTCLFRESHPRRRGRQRSNDPDVQSSISTSIRGITPGTAISPFRIG